MPEHWEKEGIPPIDTLTGGPEQTVTCKWDGCDNKSALDASSLESHLETDHLASEGKSQTCRWQDCESFGVEQPTQFSLITHVRSHAGHVDVTNYLCPIPECEAFFGQTEALAKHVKIEHDLQTLGEAVAKFKGKRNTGIYKTEAELLAVIEQNHELKNPWWFNERFINVLQGNPQGDGSVNPEGYSEDDEEDESSNDSDDSDDDDDDERRHVSRKRRRRRIQKVPFNTVYQLPLDFKQHKVATLRYKNYLESKSKLIEPTNTDLYGINVIKRQKLWEKIERGEVDDLEDESVEETRKVQERLNTESDTIKKQYKPTHIDKYEGTQDLEELKRIYTNLENKLHTANRINEIVSKQLETTVKEKRRLWLINQLLINANIEIGVPPEETNIPQRVSRDQFDDELLDK